MAESKPQKSYLTPQEVADLLMVSPVTVRQWSQKGLLASVATPGGHRRYRRQDVERFARQHGMESRPGNSSEWRILIVDDDPQFSVYLAEALSTLGAAVSVETAQDGFEAGRKVQALRPNVVLLDLMMGGLDGFEVCRRLKAERSTKDVRVIGMTGYGSEENVGRILEAGAESCLVKPFDRTELLRALHISSSID